ncbi:hypothetical protein ACTMTJ_34635 [Phytohabitans sp. LJ34]|uniref:hypothetical protein n=1 Tax=Phytohabitans sp. LJ34 TaxID=3452217 RepID=UPI003F8B5728
MAPLVQRRFVVREAVPLTFSASSSCRMVLRLADAPRLDPDGDVDTSRELIAIVVDATSFPDESTQAGWTWRTRRDFMIRDKGGGQVHDVVGLGSQAFATSERRPTNRRGRATWSYGLHLWDGNLFLSVTVTGIGEGKRFTGTDAEATATRLALGLLAALHA